MHRFLFLLGLGLFLPCYVGCGSPGADDRSSAEGGPEGIVRSGVAPSDEKSRSPVAGDGISSSEDDAENGGEDAPWFGDLLAVEPLDRKQLAGALPILRDMLRSGSARIDGLSSALLEDRRPRAVFVSVSDGETMADVACGTGQGFANAVTAAVATLRSRVAGELPTRWIKLDVVERVEPYVVDAATAPFDRSLEGLAYGRDSRVAFIPEELVARTLVSSRGEIMPRNIAVYRLKRWREKHESELPKLEDSELLRFTASSFFLGDGEVVELYRGHGPRPELTRETLLDACRRGADYLRRAVRENGSFVYGYFPKSGTEDRKYNMVRHAGTIYSMIDVYETTKDPALLAAAERAIAYLKVFIKPYGAEGSGIRIMTYGGKIKLGGVALTAVALAEHGLVTGDKKYLEDVQGLCRYIAGEQRPGGKFIHSRMYPSGQVGTHISNYYPGEALLALVRLHALDKNERWLNVAESGARYLIKVRDAGIETLELTHDHWLLYALNELYRYRRNELYFTHAMRIAEAIQHKQRQQSEFPDWVGSYYTPPRSTPTACRCEGMSATYTLARDHGQEDRAVRMLENLRLNAGFQLDSQIGPPRAMYCFDPQRVLGGFTRSLTNYEVRIDYVQHNISGLLQMYRILVDEKRDRF